MSLSKAPLRRPLFGQIWRAMVTVSVFAGIFALMIVVAVNQKPVPEWRTFTTPDGRECVVYEKRISLTEWFTDMECTE
jgi:hypothetical protein